MKPTPGPWHVQPDSMAGDHPYHQHRFITCGLADMRSDSWGHDPNSYIIATLRDCQNQQANARLIATAPKLLEACEAILEELEDRYDGAPDSNTLWMGVHIRDLVNAIGLAATPSPSPSGGPSSEP